MDFWKGIQVKTDGWDNVANLASKTILSPYEVFYFLLFFCYFNVIWSDRVNVGSVLCVLSFIYMQELSLYLSYITHLLKLAPTSRLQTEWVH